VLEVGARLHPVRVAAAEPRHVRLAVDHAVGVAPEEIAVLVLDDRVVVVVPGSR
jgi:hypothetical protein